MILSVTRRLTISSFRSGLFLLFRFRTVSPDSCDSLFCLFAPRCSCRVWGLFLSRGLSVFLASCLPLLIKPPIPAASSLLILTSVLTRGLFGRSARAGFVLPPDTMTLPVLLGLILLPGLTLELTLPGCLPPISLPMPGLATEALVLLETVVLSLRTTGGLDKGLAVPEETLGFENVKLLRGSLPIGLPMLGLVPELLVFPETVGLSLRTTGGLDMGLAVPEETLGFEKVKLLRGSLTMGALLLTVTPLLPNLVVLLLRNRPAGLLWVMPPPKLRLRTMP